MQPHRHKPKITSALFDLGALESFMRDVARSGKAVSYSEALHHLGFSFSRPKMRALCAALAVVDERAQARGEPELAVLVVRASDGIPGQGWWVGRSVIDPKYKGPIEGQEAAAYVQKIQVRAFKYWTVRKP